MEPGKIPPIYLILDSTFAIRTLDFLTSAWWPREAVQNMISLPAASKMGVMTVKSGRWVPPQTVPVFITCQRDG